MFARKLPIPNMPGLENGKFLESFFQELRFAELFWLSSKATSLSLEYFLFCFFQASGFLIRDASNVLGRFIWNSARLLKGSRKISIFDKNTPKQNTEFLIAAQNAVQNFLPKYENEQGE